MRADPGSRDDHVVDTPDGYLGSWPRRALAVVVLCVFGAVVFGTALVDAFWPVEPPKLFGREAEAQQRRRAEATFADGSLARLIEDEHRQRSRVRRYSQAVYVPLLYNLFNEVRGNQIAGSDGYVFLRSRVNAVADAALIDRSVARLHTLSKWLRRLGHRLVVMPLPRKSVVAGRHLPAPWNARPELDVEFGQRLRARGVEVVDLLTAFANHDGEPIYWRADSHWRPAGMMLSAMEVTRVVMGRNPPVPRIQRFHERAGSLTLASMLGLDPSAGRWLPDEDVTMYYPVGAIPTVHAKQPAPDAPVMLIGTSFSMHSDSTSTPFAHALAALLGVEVWNAAAAGVSPEGALATAAAATGGRLSPTIIMELPNHLALCLGNPLDQMSNAFAALPVPPGLVPLDLNGAEDGVLPAPVIGSDLRSGRIALQAGKARLLRIPWQGFVYPRDGTITAVLRGRVRAGAVSVGIDRHEMMWVEWKAGDEVVAVPFSGAGIGSTLDVALVSPQVDCEVELDAVGFVCDLDLANPTAGTVAAGAAGTGPATVLFAAAAPLGDDCVAIRLGGAPGPARRVEVAATATDGRRAVLFAGEVLPDARLLLPLLALQGGVLSTVTVQGAAATAPEVRWARLLRRLPVK